MGKRRKGIGGAPGNEYYLEVLKVAHHGLGTQQEKSFCTVKPEKAVISCGKENSYGHPHKEIAEEIEERSPADSVYQRADREQFILL